MMHHEDIDETQIRLVPFNCIGAARIISGKIMGAVFGSHAEARTPASEASGDVTSSSEAAAAGSHVDVTVILDKAVARKKEKLAWRTSIVDLLG